MSDMAMKYEDWLRGCVHHDGRKGNVYLPYESDYKTNGIIEEYRDKKRAERLADHKTEQTEREGE